MQSISQENETFQILGENFLFMLHWNGSWRRLHMWGRCWLYSNDWKGLQADQSPGFFLTLISLSVVLELNPFLSNLPLWQNFSWEDPQALAPNLSQIQDMLAIMLAIYCLCKINTVILTHEFLHLMAWIGTLRSQAAWLQWSLRNQVVGLY